MVFTHTNSKGQLYNLHQQDVPLKGGRIQRIYFFARTVRDNSCEVLPAGYIIVENPRTGLPCLKKG